jgi:hypothetical protein
MGTWSAMGTARRTKALGVVESEKESTKGLLEGVEDIAAGSKGGGAGGREGSRRRRC